MRDYLPLDLSRFANAGARVLGKKDARIPTGKQAWHGIPFLVKPRAGKKPVLGLLAAVPVHGWLEEGQVLLSARRVQVFLVALRREQLSAAWLFCWNYGA